MLTCAVTTYLAGVPAALIGDVDYGGSSLNFTRSNTSSPGATNIGLSIWHYANNVDTTAATVTARRGDGSTENIRMVIQEWKGLDTVAPKDADGATNGSTTAISTATSGATTAGQRLALHAFGQESTTTSYTMNANYIQRYAEPSGTIMALGVQSREFTGGGVETATATLVSTASNHASVIAVFQPPSAATFMYQPDKANALPHYRM
jgi:hypothetical protein